MILPPSLADVCAWCALNVGRSFDVVLAGEVVGGRYGEAPQRLKHARLENDMFTVSFNTTELMTVVKPSDIYFAESGLLIGHAIEVSFGWHSYGSEAIPKNWRVIRCRPEGDIVYIERLSSTRTEIDSPIPKPNHLVRLVLSDA